MGSCCSSIVVDSLAIVDRLFVLGPLAALGRSIAVTCACALGVSTFPVEAGLIKNLLSKNERIRNMMTNSIENIYKTMCFPVREDFPALTYV